MLTSIVLTVALLIVSAAMIQLAFAVYFSIFLGRKKTITLPFEQQNQTAVLMSLRGCDPSLRHALIGILNQEYESYQVHLVVDHHSDAAWDIVHEIKREHDLNDIIKIHEMVQPLETCGLKCSALVQGLQKIGDDTKYLVLMDADVRPHSTWLAEAIGPLAQDSTIGIVTGNQWFEPSAGSGWGTLIRSLWSAGALVPTILFQNLWAGTMAIRLSDIDLAKLTTTWRHSAVDDGPLRELLDSLNLKTHFAPSLIMVNRERCTINYVVRWVTRMLTWSRLYESTFLCSVVHAIFSNVIMLMTFGFLVAGLCQLSLFLSGIALASLLISGSLSVLAYLIVRSAVSRTCLLKQEMLGTLSAVRLTRLLLSVVLAQLTYGYGCFKAIFSQQILWREITYEVSAGDQVRMMHYQPITQTTDNKQSNVSL